MSFKSWFQSWWPPWSKKLNWRNQFESPIDFRKAVVEGNKNKTYSGKVNLSNIKIKGEGGEYLAPNDDQFKDLVVELIKPETRQLNVSGNALTAEKLKILYDHIINKSILLDSINIGSLEECPDRQEFLEYHAKNKDAEKDAKSVKDSIILEIEENGLRKIKRFEGLTNKSTAEEIKNAFEDEINDTNKKLKKESDKYYPNKKEIARLNAKLNILKPILARHQEKLDNAIKYETLKTKSDDTAKLHAELLKVQGKRQIETRPRSKIHPVVMHALKPEPLMKPEDVLPKRMQQGQSEQPDVARKSKTHFYDPDFPHRPVVQKRAIPTSTELDLKKAFEGISQKHEDAHQAFEERQAEVDKNYSLQPVQSDPKKSTASHQTNASNQTTASIEEPSEFDPSKPLPLQSFLISGGPKEMPTEPVVDKTPSQSESQSKQQPESQPESQTKSPLKPGTPAKPKH